MSFIHLRTHTEYSVVDGTLRIDDAAAAARRDGQPALAITDLANVFGAVKFYKACRDRGVKPLIGADLWMQPEAGERQPSRLLVLVQDSQGYLNLCELLARAWTSNAQRAQAWVRWEWLDSLGAGLIALSGAEHGALGQALMAGDEARARAVVQRLAALFPGRCYVELQRAGLPGQEAVVQGSVALAAELGLPVVATHPVQFLEPDDFDAHEARVCVAEGETLANPKRVKRFTRGQWFRPTADMAALFADLPSALANTLGIARRCNLRLTLGKPRLPHARARRRLADADRGLLSRALASGAGATPGAALPRCSRACRPTPRVPAAPGIRDRRHRQDGFPRLLPDRRRLHRLGAAQRLPGRPRAGLGRGLARGLCAGHHRPGPASLPAALRALPEPRARVDARLRH
jgi:DNA polymerase III alpha subunit